ncbi:MAG: DUF1573 domain-containing protein [Paludibacteraceae bacterium]|nr:DUF1573 domain-containing protein [Paludibacteraceae bacterium]
MKATTYISNPFNKVNMKKFCLNKYILGILIVSTFTAQNAFGTSITFGTYTATPGTSVTGSDGLSTISSSFTPAIQKIYNVSTFYVWQINANVSTDLTQDYVQIKAPSSSYISQLVVDASSNGTTVRSSAYVAFDASNNVVEAGTFTAASNAATACSATISLTSANISYVRFYRKITIPIGTLYGGSTITSTQAIGDGNTFQIAKIVMTYASGCTVPTFSTQPTDGLSECAGGTITLGTVVANYPSYQWYSNTSKTNTGGTAVSTGTGGTTATYTPPSTTAGTYYYYCVATNGSCTTASNAVTFTVNTIPTITLGSMPSVISGTTSANLTYSATTGSPNQYSIVWNTAATTAGFSNVTNTTLSSSPIVLAVPSGATAGTYTGTLTVTNSTTGCVSTSYTITVSVSSNAVTTSAITGSPFCAGGVVSVGFTSTGTFTSGNVYTAQLSDASGSFSSPTAIGTLTSTANSGTISGTIPAGTTTGTGYRIRVIASTPATTGTDNGTNLTVNTITTITTQPSSASATVGGAVTLTVAATGSGTLTYQWYSNTSASNSGGTSLGTSAQTASYSPSTATAGNFYYYCIVSGTCGSVTSSAVTVSVTSVSSSVPVPSIPTNGCNTLTWTCTDASTVSYDVKICSGTVSDLSVTPSSWTTLPTNSNNYTAINYGFNSGIYLGASSNVASTGKVDATATQGYLQFDLPNGASTLTVAFTKTISIQSSTDGGSTWTNLATAVTTSPQTVNVNNENAVKIRILNGGTNWAYITSISTTNYTGCTSYNTTAKSYTPTGLSSNTLYYVAVKNNETSSSSSWSPVLNYYTSPDAPVITSATATANAITLNWSMPSGSNILKFGVKYKLHSSSTWITFIANNTYTGITATITGLSASLSYDYQVVVSGPVCSGIVSGTITTAPDVPVPTSSNPTTSGFKVSWPAVSNADGYEVKVCKMDTTVSTYSLNSPITTANGWATIPNTMTGVCSYTGVMPSTNSAFQTNIYENGFSMTSAKVSTDCQGIIAYSSSTQIITPVLTSAHTLTFSAAGYASGYTVTVSASTDGGSSWTTIKTVTCNQQWTSSTALASFSVPINITTPVMLKLVPSGEMFFTNIKVTDALSCNTVSSITTTSYTPTSLDPNTKYYYAVRSYKNNSGIYSYSDWSTVSASTTQVTLENAPTCGTPSTSDVVSGFNAKWNAPAVTGGSETYSYKLQLKDASGTTAIGSPVSVPSSNTTYNFTSVSSNTTYKYDVWAVNAGGSSDTIHCGPITTMATKSLTIKIDPAGTGSVLLGTYTITKDTVLNLNVGLSFSMQAKAGSGYSFLRWVIDDNRYTDNPYTITIADDMTAIASFAAQTCTTTNFDALTSTDLATGSYKTQSVAIGGASWDVVLARLSTSNYHSSPNCIRLAYPASGDTSSIISPLTVTPASISFYARTASNAGSAWVYLSTDGGTTYKVVTKQAVTTTQTLYTVTLSTTSSYCRIKISNASTSGSTGYDMYVDDITICGAPDATPPALTFYPVTGSINVPISTIPTITSDEKLYYYTSSGSFAELTNTALSDPSVLSRILSLTKASNDSAITFSASISADGKTITITPSSTFYYSTQYKLSIKYVADANNNMLASTLYTLFTTKGVPQPHISVKENLTHTSYANASTYNMGTIISGASTATTFKVYNTGSDPLNISSCTTSGTAYSIGTALSKTTIPSGDSATVTVTFTPGSTAGVYSGTLNIVSNDATNSPYIINLSGIKAKFVLPYTYQSGCTTPVVSSTELTHDYSSTTDIPTQVQIGNLSSSSAVTTANFNPSYDLFHAEGNCLADGNSALRVGTSKKSLILDLDSCGQITFKWTASGYRKVSVTDALGNVYLQSSTWLEGGKCYTNSVVINSCAHTRIMISFEASDSTILSTLYYLNITKCSAELKSSAKDIVKYSFGDSNEKVRIYDNYIFVTLPSSYAGSLSTLVAKTIEVSPKATVVIKTTGDNFGDSTVVYRVTAEDGTTKDYTVSIELETVHNNYYSNIIAIPVAMNESDKKLSVLEISNTTCTVPSNGDGSDYTLHFLDPKDKPIGGYKIAGLSKLCVGSRSTYTLSNAAVTNNPSYSWKLIGAGAKQFTIVGDTVSSSLTIQAPTTIDSTSLQLNIFVDFNSDKCQWTTGSASLNIQVTKTPPDQVGTIAGGCLDDNGYLTLTAHGAGASATTYNWSFNPSSTQISSQNDSSIVLNIGSSVNDISTTINTQNGCGITKGTKTFPVDYATAATTWTGAISGDWNINSNWTARVPKSCTNVTIPDVSASGVNYPTITATGECNYITFEQGAAVLGLPKLAYNKAFVEMDLKRNKWYTLTAPLKNMYSGDYYFSAGAPVTYMRLFDAINPDSLSNGHLYTGTWTRTFANLKVALTPGSGFAYNIDSTVWNYPKGRYFSHDDKALTFPRMNSDSSLITTYIPYASFTGKPLISQAISETRYDSIAYRFAMENNSNVLSNLTIPLNKGLNLIGNPLMTHLDVAKLLTHNSSISSTFRFWNGSTFVTYTSTGVGSGIWSDGSYTGTLIAPMQSFIVDAASASSLTFLLNSDFVADAAKTSKLRAATATENLMYITSTNGTTTSSTSITRNSDATNGYKSNEDAFKLFTSITSVPDIYTLADGVALGINQFKEVPYVAPLGIKTTQYGKITLAFSGAESFGNDVDVSLINTKTGDTINVKEQPTYTVTLDSTNAVGSLFVQFKNATITTNAKQTVASSIQIYTKDNNVIRVISAPNNLIKAITIMDETGKKVVEKSGISTSLFDMVMNNGEHVYIVRAVTEKEVKIAKVLIK